MAKEWTRQAFRHIGLAFFAGVLAYGGAILTGALPQPGALIESIRNRVVPVCSTKLSDSKKFKVLLIPSSSQAPLDFTPPVRAFLEEYPYVEHMTASRTISVNTDKPSGLALSESGDMAKRYASDCGADLAIWGEVINDSTVIIRFADEFMDWSKPATFEEVGIRRSVTVETELPRLPEEFYIFFGGHVFTFFAQATQALILEANRDTSKFNVDPIKELVSRQVDVLRRNAYLDRWTGPPVFLNIFTAVTFIYQKNGDEKFAALADDYYKYAQEFVPAAMMPYFEVPHALLMLARAMHENPDSMEALGYFKLAEQKLLRGAADLWFPDDSHGRKYLLISLAIVQAVKAEYYTVNEYFRDPCEASMLVNKASANFRSAEALIGDVMFPSTLIGTAVTSLEKLTSFYEDLDCSSPDGL
ncbi:MAG: hypothetical protein AAF662_03095 [Pseudomonadota bacterium]